MKIHLVKKGDTLFEIAKKHGVGLEQLVAANSQLTDPDRLEVGMKIRIPSIPKPVPQPPVEYKHKHTVSSGDTMWKLSKAWEVPLKAMIDANPHIKNPNILMTGDTVYIPKLNADGELTALNKAELTAPLGKANTAPIAEALPSKAPNQPIPEVPVTPVAPVAPEVMEEKPAEKPVEKSAEKPMAPVVEQEAESPAKKTEAPSVVENLTLPTAQKPEHSNPLPILQGMQEAAKPEFPPVAAPLTSQANPAPIAEASKEAAQPLCPPLPPFHTGPVAGASKDASMPLCPPLPEFANPYAGYFYPQVPAYPQAGAYQSQPQAYNPYQQIPVPAVEAFAYGQPGWGQAGMENCHPYEQMLPYQAAFYPQAMNPYDNMYAAAHMGQPFPWGEPDCGCGGGMPNLPYALAPEANTAPQDMQSFPNQPPYAGAQQQQMQPYPPGYGLPDQGYQAGMPQPFVQGYPGYPGYAGMTSYPAAGPMPTYATPYANPYTFPDVSPQGAPHAGTGAVEAPGRIELAQADIKDQAKAAKKEGQVRTSSKPRSERSTLQSFIDRQRSKQQASPKDNRPWINL